MPRRDRPPLLAPALLLTCLAGASASAERLPLQNFTIKDGLPSDNVSCLVRDLDGFIWICTSEGLAYYDGFVFRAFRVADGLPHRRVTQLLRARDGTYWIGTEGGLVRFRPKGRAEGEPRFTVVEVPQPTHWTPDGVISSLVTALFQDRSGRIWCGTAQAGLFVVSERDGHLELRMAGDVLPINTWINAIQQSADGQMWIGTSRGLLRGPDLGHRDPATFRGSTTDRPELTDQDVLSVLVRDSSVLAGTRYTGLHLLDIAGPDVTLRRSWRTPDAHRGDRVHGILASSDGHVWYAGAAGAHEVRPDDPVKPGVVRIWGQRSGIGSSNVTSVAEDVAGNIWIGTDGSGVFRLRRGGFTTYTVDDGLAGDQVKDVLTADGALHVVTADVRGMYLNRLRGHTFVAAARPHSVDPLHNRATHLVTYDRRGDWWIATPTGFVRTSGRAFDAVLSNPTTRLGLRDGLWSDAAYKVFEDSRGDVWLGNFMTLHNLSRWERHTGRIHRQLVRTFPYQAGYGFGFVPESFAEAPEGTVWVGSFYGGLARYVNGRWDYFDVEDGVPEGRVAALLRDQRGRLWVGTSHGGLARVERPEDAHPTFVSIKTTDGLSSNNVIALTEDLEGRIYVGTGSGIDRLTPDPMAVRSFGEADGLPGGRVVTAFRDRQGDLWFGTNQGLARFTPSAFRDPDWPTLRVMRVLAPGYAMPLSDLGEPAVPAIEFKPRQNAVQITVGALASGPMPGLRFEGRLEGSDADWVPVEPGRPVMLLNLQPGAYRFVARATASGRVGPSTVSVTFTILRPWWQRPWALVLQALLLAGLGAAAYNLRIRHLLAIERVRSRIASDLHDDVGTSLSRMALISEAARGHQGGDLDVALGALGEVASTARLLASDVADLAWASDPHDDTVANVIGRASWFGSELFVIRGTEWRCTVDESAAARRLGPEDKRHLLLLLKEALNNIAKHADARAASLEARVVEGQLVITIVDDGRGFDAATAPRADGNGNGNGSANGGRGLSNMAARARALGGSCEVSSASGAGCRITIRVP